MSDQDKALVERLRSRAKWLEPELDVLDENEVLAAADRIEALEAQLKTVLDREAETHRRHDAKVEAQAAEIEQLRELLAAAYIELSGKDEHASDCATSNAPAMTPGRCDCD